MEILAGGEMKRRQIMGIDHFEMHVLVHLLLL